MRKRFFTIFCSTLMLAGALAGCGSTDIDNAAQVQIGSSGEQIVNLMYGIEARDIGTESIASPESTIAATDFGLRLLSQSIEEGENTLISPLSVLMALGMTTNGADSKTLKQMEEVFGMTRNELNEYLYAYAQGLPQGDKYKLTLANSIWINDEVSPMIKEDFLQISADWYDVQIFKAPFIKPTVTEINNWVKRNTDGMISEILDQIPPETLMYLINALAFDAEWDTIYKDTQVHDGIFTTAEGTEQKVEMMYSSESLYLEDENAVGFIKYYADSSYAFVALLPEEGVSVAEYVASLNGERLNQLLTNPQSVEVNASIPKFQCEYSTELSNTLKAMGMTDAFDAAAADFSPMGATEALPFYISRVLHKTYIAVDERGTRAGAVTAVAMTGGGRATSDPKIVYLDRPFVYMLIDCEEKLPVFIGTLEHIE